MCQEPIGPHTRPFMISHLSTSLRGNLIFGRRRLVSGDDDLALGPQGDVRRLFRKADDDDGGTG